jgi:hypothetical protein
MSKAHTTDVGVDETGYFTGDRYDRLCKSAEIIASDENIAAGDFPYNSEGLRAYAASIKQLGLLDRLSEHDSNTVAMYAVLDFTQGAERMAWRIYDLMQDEPTVHREDDDDAMVLYALVCILRLLVSAFLKPDPRARLRGLMHEIEDADADLRYAQDVRDEAAADLLTAKTALRDAIEAL